MNLYVDPVLGTGILVPTDMITDPYPSISQVPEKTMIRFDRRSLPGETEEVILKEISDVVHACGVANFTLEVVKNTVQTYTGKAYERKVSLDPWSISEEAPLFQTMYRSAEKVMAKNLWYRRGSAVPMVLNQQVDGASRPLVWGLDLLRKLILRMNTL